MDVSFSRLQIIFLLIMSVGISNHVLIIPHLLETAGRDAWIGILLAYAVLVLWGILLYFIMKSMRDTTVKQWVEIRIGRLGYFLIGGAIALFLIIAGMIIVFDTTKNVSIYFLPQTHPYIVIGGFVFLCYQAASKGLKTIVYMAIMLLPFVWVLGFGVSTMTMSNKDYSMLLPVMTEGIGPGMRGAGIVLGGSLDLIMLVLLQHKLSKPVNYGMIIVLITILTGLIIGPTIGSLTAFGPYQAANLRFPAFEQWRLVTIGRYVSHVDFLAVFQLMAGSVVRTALLIYLLTHLIAGRSAAFRKAATIMISAVISLPSLFMISDIKVQGFIHNVFYSYSLWGFIALTVVMLTVSFIPKREDGTNEASK